MKRHGWKGLLVLFPVVILVILSGCLSGSGTPQDETNLQALNFTKYVGMSDVQDTFLVFGTAQNVGELPIQRVKLRIDYEDANHTVIASRIYDDVVIIQPNETWEFEIPFTDPVVPRIRYYYITPLRVEFVK